MDLFFCGIRKPAVVFDPMSLEELNLKRSPPGWSFWICLGAIFLLIQGFTAWSAGAQSEGKPGVFFSQGQAIYNPQDRSKSQHEAIQDFLAQAVAQAAATVLSPAQLGKQYQVIQEKILEQPDRYVRTYEVFSESPGQGGLYRVAGQVTVATDLLRKDLVSLGLAHSEAEISQPSVVSPTREAPPASEADMGEALEKKGKTLASGREIFWVVSEKWEDEWYLPGDSRNPEGLFAACVFQGSRDYGWSIRLPQMGTLSPDRNGEVSSSQTLAQAKALGLQHAVIGTVALRRGDADEGRVQAGLRLLIVSSGKALEEIHKELEIGNSSNQEVAIELADFIIPQLDRQLRDQSSVSGSADEGAVKPEEGGELVLQIKSRDAYADWLALETALREQFKNMQVKGFEIRPEESIVRLLGVDGASLRNLHETRLPNGAQVQIVSLDAGNNAFSVTFLRAEKSPAEPRQ